MVKALLAAGADVNKANEVSVVLCFLWSCFVNASHLPLWPLTCSLPYDHLHGSYPGCAAVLLNLL